MFSSPPLLSAKTKMSPRAANCPRTPIFFSILFLKCFLHRLRRCNLSPCFKLLSASAHVTFFLGWKSILRNIRYKRFWCKCFLLYQKTTFQNMQRKFHLSVVSDCKLHLSCHSSSPPRHFCKTLGERLKLLM